MDEEYQISDRKFWSDKLMDLANFSMVSLVFTQFTSQYTDLRSLVFGFTIYATIVMFSVYLRIKKYAN